MVVIIIVVILVAIVVAAITVIAVVAVVVVLVVVVRYKSILLYFHLFFSGNSFSYLLCSRFCSMFQCFAQS